MTLLERRVARLEAIPGNADGVVECELSEEGKELLRATLAGLHSSEEIERIVNTKVLGAPALSLASKRQLADMHDALAASADLEGYR